MIVDGMIIGIFVAAALKNLFLFVILVLSPIARLIIFPSLWLISLAIISVLKITSNSLHYLMSCLIRRLRNWNGILAVFVHPGEVPMLEMDFGFDSFKIKIFFFFFDKGIF